MLELLGDQLDHDRVVDVADARQLVRDHVVRIDEVHQRVEDPRPIAALESPLGVVKHGE